MTLKLPDTVASSQDVTALILNVREYARWFAHESIKKRVDVRHHSEPPVLSPAAMMIIKEWKAGTHADQKSLDTIIATLVDYSRSSPSITFTLAAPPTGDIKATLIGWCRQHIAPNVLVTFKFNATILGGMVVQYGSRVFDWSFRRQLLAQRQHFPEVLRRV